MVCRPLRASHLLLSCLARAPCAPCRNASAGVLYNAVATSARNYQVRKGGVPDDRARPRGAELGWVWAGRAAYNALPGLPALHFGASPPWLGPAQLLPLLLRLLCRTCTGTCASPRTTQSMPPWPQQVRTLHLPAWLRAGSGAGCCRWAGRPPQVRQVGTCGVKHAAQPRSQAGCLPSCLSPSAFTPLGCLCHHPSRPSGTDGFWWLDWGYQYREWKKAGLWVSASAMRSTGGQAVAGGSRVAGAPQAPRVRRCTAGAESARAPRWPGRAPTPIYSRTHLLPRQVYVSFQFDADVFPPSTWMPDPYGAAYNVRCAGARVQGLLQYLLG